MANTQQLKGDIDAGKTGDKIPQGFDPGLSTLGTDDEASGNPPTPHQVSMARQLESANARQPEEQGANSRTPSGRPTPWIIGALVVVVLVVVVAAFVMGRL